MLTTLRECQDAARMRESYAAAGNEIQFHRELGDLLENNQVPIRQISLRNLWEAFVPDGRDLLERMRPGYRASGTTMLMEAGDFVSTSAFSAIIGQITYATVMEALAGEQFIGMDLVSTESASTQQPEIVPGITMIGDVAEDVGEGQEYPRVGLGAEYITIPRKVKDGFILELSEEAIWEDKTGLLMQRANSGTVSMGQTMEKEILDTVLGITTSYSRNGGPQQATYGDTHTQGTFDNLVASNALVNYTDIEAAILILAAITDPNTGEPVFISAPDLIVPLDLYATAQNIVNATEIRVGDGASASVQTLSPNPVRQTGKNRAAVSTIHSNAYVKQRTSSGSTWFIGDAKAAFGYSEIWPVQVFRMEGQSSGPGFSRDIVSSVKVRRKGVPFVREPRKMAKCTA